VRETLRGREFVRERRGERETGRVSSDFNLYPLTFIL